MHKLLILFLSLSSGWVQSQSLSPEVIATAGEHFATANAQLSWTLGEPVIETYTGDKSQLTQGFHQTQLTVVAVNEPVAAFPVLLYPNPTTALLTVEAPESPQAFGLELLDGSGRLLHRLPAAAPAAPRTLDLSGYAPGLYLLQLRSGDGRSIQSFKIIKHN